MKLLIKNTFLSLRGNSKVLTEDGKLAYKVKGRLLSNLVGVHKKVIKDANGKKLFVVRNKFWHKPFYKSAIIFKDGKKLALVQNSHFIKNGYEVKGATEDIAVEGKGWDLDITLGGKKIGHIAAPNKLAIADAYTLEVDDPEDAPFLVAMMIAIDNIYDQKRMGG